MEIMLLHKSKLKRKTQIHFAQISIRIKIINSFASSASLLWFFIRFGFAFLLLRVLNRKSRVQSSVFHSVDDIVELGSFINRCSSPILIFSLFYISWASFRGWEVITKKGNKNERMWLWRQFWIQQSQVDVGFSSCSCQSVSIPIRPLTSAKRKRIISFHSLQ